MDAKSVIILWVLCLQLLVGNQVVSGQGNTSYSRVSIGINDNWQFAKAADAENDNWQKVNLPHTWNATDVLDDIPGYYRGVGWYKKTFTVPVDYKGKDVFLYFEGANQQTQVYLNGNKAGEHIGGYTAFYIPASQWLKYNEENELLVRVDNTHNLNIPPLEADFAFYGGIYRDVSLLALHPVHFSCKDYGSNGTYISLPEVSVEKAMVAIKSLITCLPLSATDKNTELQVVIRDRDEKMVANQTSRILKNSAADVMINQSLSIRQPHLWTPEDPYLYAVSLTIKDRLSGKIYDELTQPLGIKWVSVDAGKGFFLNGKPYKLIGASRHQDFKGLGNAVPHSIAIHDMELLKEMGGNFLRSAHYPHDQVVLQACDRLGILASVEIPLVNEITETDSFYNNCMYMQNEMIRQYFNHPSVAIWCHMNEIMIRPSYPNDKEKQKQYFANIVSLAKRMDSNAHMLDPQRLTMIANHGAFERYNETGLTGVGDIVGWNLYSGWYGGTLDGFGEFLDKHHKVLPTRPVMVTEYGADADPRISSNHPVRFDKSIEYATRFHQQYLADIRKRPFVAGGAIWNLADFIAEPRQETMPHTNNKGMLTIDRRPKSMYYFYQMALAGRPMMKILQMPDQTRGGAADSGGAYATQLIQVAANTDSAMLMINGKWLNKQKVINGLAEWQVPFLNGKNHLLATDNLTDSKAADVADIPFQLFPYLFTESVTTPAGFDHLNILLGADRYFTDERTKELWIPDQPYTKGSWGYIGGKAFKMSGNTRLPYGTDKNIFETVNDPVYQTQQTEIEKYRLDVPNGLYEITLHFAELEGGEAINLAYNLSTSSAAEKKGERIFDVAVNGQSVIAGLNLEKQYGIAVPVTKRVRVQVQNKQGIQIEFKAIQGAPVLNALQVTRLTGF